jgi:micrococcal nuclease
MLNWFISLIRPIVIKDGDTLTFKGQRIRLFGIDAPELDQPGGKGAKKHLEWLLKQAGRIEVEIKGKDKYNRSIGIIYGQGIKDISINQLMVRGGEAVAYMSTKYLADAAVAKKKKLGWVGRTKEFITPAVWRRRKRK